MTDSLMSLLHEVLRKQDEMDHKVDRLVGRRGDIGGQLAHLAQQLDDLIDLVGSTPETTVATHAVLTLTQGVTMPGAINVDTTNETVTLNFVDDKGNVATGPDGVVVTFASDNTAVATIATDPTNSTVGDVTVVGEGTANLSATLANADGSPVLEADGTTPFPTPDPVTVTVSAGAAVGDSLVLSV